MGENIILGGGKTAPNDGEGKLADYALAFDLFSTIAVSRNEEEVVNGTIRFYDTICAPAYIAYLPFYGDIRGSLRCRSRLAGQEKEIAEKLASFDKESGWTGSGKGFTLRISHAGEKLGVIELEGMAFPEYREHYLNLAINSAGVLGLAISNARIYQMLEGKNKDLEKAKEELQRFFNLVPDMVCVASTDGYFLKINAIWQTILGYTEQEILSTPFLDFIHPDDRDATMKEMERQIAGEATIEFVNRYRCKDGSYKSLEWTAMPSPDKKQFFAAARDITDHKKAEDALRESQDDFRKIMENSLVPMALTDEEQRIHFLNEKFTQLFGYTLTDIPTVEEWWPRAYPDPSCREEVKTEWNRRVGAVMREGVEFVPMEAVVVCKDGNRRDIVFYFSFIRNRGLTVFHDITEHKAMEDRLRASESALSKAQEIAHLGNWELDIQTGKTIWSDELRRMYGLAPEEAEPAFDRFMGLVHPEDRKIIEENMHKIKSGEPPQTAFEVRIIRPDGEERNILGKLEVVTGKNGKPAKLIGINLDITERKLMEKAVLRSKKLASIVTLSAGVAHEILNPLNIIGTTAQLLIMDEPQGPIHEKMQSILGQIQRAVKIVKNLGMFASKNRMEVEDVHLSSCFDQAAGSMERDLKANNIIIERHFAPTTPPIKGDAQQLEQIFGILIANARDALNPRSPGTITVAVRPVDRGAEFKFCDNGPGIPADIIEKVFDPFFTTKDPGKGTGLGLSMAHRIIEDHGGTISLESEAGKTCFTIFLPKDGDPLVDLQ